MLMVKIRRLRRKLKKNSNVILVAVVIFLAGFVLGASIKPSAASNSSQPEQSAGGNNTQVTTLSGEYIFKNMCMKCHTSPERYKSFTTYFGKPPSVWAIGVQKMISVGNVQLSPEEVKAVTEYLAKTFKR